jgi:threonine/homoserine/homoserine lactone efflux protein
VIVFEPLLAGLVAGYAVAMPVGAFAVLLVTLTAHTSVRVGAAGALGVATADGLYAAAALLGGAALAYAVHPVMGPLRWTAAVVLVGLAARMIFKVRTAAGARGAGLDSLGTPARAYVGFLGMTLLNPWAIIYFAALAVTQHDHDAVRFGSFTAGVFTASLTWQLFLALSGNALGRVIVSSRGRLVITALSALVIVALAIVLVTAPTR